MKKYGIILVVGYVTRARVLVSDTDTCSTCLNYENFPRISPKWRVWVTEIVGVKKEDQEHRLRDYRMYKWVFVRLLVGPTVRLLIIGKKCMHWRVLIVKLKHWYLRLKLYRFMWVYISTIEIFSETLDNLFLDLLWVSKTDEAGWKKNRKEYFKWSDR